MSSISQGYVPWPDADAARYVEKGHWTGCSLDEQVWAVAAGRPDAVAVVDGHTRLTYGNLTARADAAAVRLEAAGLRPGDTVAVQLPNCWQLIVLVLACFRAGVVPVMVLPAHRLREVTAVTRQASVRAIAVASEFRGFDHEAMAHEVRRSVPSVELVLALGGGVDRRSIELETVCAVPEDELATPGHAATAGSRGRDIALLLLSSGTTGMPKLIARTHDDYGYLIRHSVEVSGFDEDTVYLAALPVEHNFALGTPGVFGALFAGGRTVLARTPSAQAAITTIERERVTLTSVVPAILQNWLDYLKAHPGSDLGSLRVLQVGGARLPVQLADRALHELPSQLQQVYGMGEGLLCFTRLDDPVDVVRHAQGRPLSQDDELLIVDDNDLPVAPGEAGVLLTRGPYTPRGYYRAEEYNNQAFASGGWYRTGDIVRLRADGNVMVEGRAKDVIIRGGENIAAEEIEQFAYQVDGVRQAAAFPVTDERLGERTCVAVVPHPGATVELASIHAVMERAGVARFKYPDQLVCIDVMPLTGVGKIDKRTLQARTEGLDV